MRPEYDRVDERWTNGIWQRIVSTYVRIFGIPEIGFQLRGMHFRRCLAKHVVERRPSRVLDAGCGIGAYSLLLNALFPDAEVVGYEIDDRRIADCNAMVAAGPRSVHFERHDLTEPVIDARGFDLIVNVDVLEHVPNYEAVLDNFAKLLTNGGFLFIHTPQANQRRIFARLTAWSHQDHVREGFDPCGLSKDLVDRGFSVVQCRETFGPFGKLAWELNHLALRSSLALAAMSFPLLYLLATLDLVTRNRRGLGVALLAAKT